MGEMTSRTVLLTGAAGTIGSAIRPALRARHREVRLLDMRLPPDPQPGETAVVASILDPAALEVAASGADCIVHLAGIPQDDAWPALRAANIDGTLNVFEAARHQGVRRVVFASSHHVIAFRELGTHVAIDAEFRPSGLYGATKVFGEALGGLYAAKYGIEVVCLRIAAFQPQPHNHRELLLWISPRDMAQLVLRSIEADSIGFLTVFGVSNNTRNPYERAGWEQLGYRPEDDSEHWVRTAPDLMGHPTQASDRYYGGEACLRHPVER
jgi:uronate dehydrogenase